MMRASAGRVIFTTIGMIIFSCLQNNLSRAQISEAQEHVPLTLFQIIARSDLVVHVVVKDGAQRYAMVDVVETLRGEAPGEKLRIDFRDLNLQLRGQELIVFNAGEEDVLFLQKPNWRKPKESREDIYALFHGRRGKLLLPPEGLGIPVEAVREMARLVGRPPDEQLASLRTLMLKPNPVLREAALDELTRMQACSIADLGPLATLARDPLPEIRARALAAIGLVLKDPGDELAQEPRRIALELCRERARNDGAPTVRVEATRALGSWDRRDDVIPDLRAIARTDPDQSVRYAAERVLFLWGIPTKDR